MLQAAADCKFRLGLADYISESHIGKNCHPRLISSVTKLYKKSDQDEFILEFIKVFAGVLMQNEKLNVSNILEFIGKFCSHLDIDTDPLVLNVIKFVTQVSNREQNFLRLRICEFISILLRSMGPQAALSEESFDMITESIMDRMQDKSTTIRSKAVTALQRLQDPQNDECPVIRVYLYHIEFDPAAEVRKKILENIAISPKTLPFIIGRSRDINEMVRKAMYKTIAKLKFSRFRIVHRQTLLSNGFHDRSATVRDFVKKDLVKTWFEHCSRDLLIFLEHLDVQTFDPEVMGILLHSQFSQLASAELVEIISSLLNPDKLIPIDKLKPETAVLWLYIVKYLREPPEKVVVEDGIVEAILPTLTVLGMFIQIIGKGLTRNNTSLEFTLSCLIKLAACTEMDVSGVSTMTATCQDLLLNSEIYSESLITSIAELLQHLISDPHDRIIFVAETCADIQCPLETNEDEENEDDDNVNDQDRDAIVKVLLLACETLKARDMVMDPTVFSFCDNVIIPRLTHPDMRVVAKAVTALSFACLLDANLAKQNFIKFQILIDLDEITSAPALEAFFNQLLIHGLAPFFPEETGDDTDVEVERKHLLDLSNEPLLTHKMKRAFGRVLTKLEAKDVEIRSIAAQGLAKLMLSGQLRSPQILARLIILWFNPDLGQDSQISQPLGMFFNIFCKRVSSSGDIILGSAVPLIEHIINAPPDSPTYLVDLSSICNFVITLLRPNLIPLSTPSHQYLLAITLIDYLLSHRSLSGPFLSVAKSLPLIELQKSDEEYLPKLSDNLNKLIQKLKKHDEKAALKRVVSLQNKINAMRNGQDKSRIKEKSQVKAADKADTDDIDDKNVFEDTPARNRRSRSRSRTPSKAVPTSRRQIIHDTIEEKDEDNMDSNQQSSSFGSTVWESSQISDRQEKVTQDSQVDMFDQ